jgi:hypothetical protein
MVMVLETTAKGPALNAGNPVVADSPGVDMTFAILSLALRMYFVTILTICSHDGGNDCRSVDLYVNQRPDW